MDVKSVNSGSSAAANASRQTSANRQAAEARKTEQAKPAEPQQKKVETQQQTSWPVVNAQGQQTGTRVNVTA